MRWRLHKSCKILSGVRLNIEKKERSIRFSAPNGTKLTINNKSNILGTEVSQTTQLTQRLDLPTGKSSTTCPFCGHRMRKQWDNCPKCKRSLVKNIAPPPELKAEQPLIDTEYEAIAPAPNVLRSPTSSPSKKNSCLGCLVIIILLSLISSCLFGGGTSKKDPIPSSTTSSATAKQTKDAAPTPVSQQTKAAVQSTTDAAQTQKTPPPTNPASTEKTYQGGGPNGEGIKGHIDKKKGTMIYHLPGDPYYGRTTHVSQWFFTEKEAQSAGYRHILK